MPIYYSETMIGKGNHDFVDHLSWAKSFLNAPQDVPKDVLNHAAWQWAVVAARLTLGGSWNTDALAVTLGSTLLSVGILFWLFRKKLSPFLSGVFAISLVVAAPIALLYPFDRALYFGYIGNAIYHNPTIILLKPFALLQFVFSVQAIQGKNASWKAILITALVSSIAVFAKPNYVICLLPSLAIFTLWRILKKEPVDWKRIIIGIVLPSIAILIWQFTSNFGAAEEGGVIFAPFAAMYTLSYKYLLIKFILSIIFPLVVTLVYWKESIKDIRIQFGWIGFGFGAIFTYFFAESGQRFNHGNFTWSGIITLFILFVCCALFLSEKGFPSKNRLANWLIISAGTLHVVFGVIYYFVIYFTMSYY